MQTRRQLIADRLAPNARYSAESEALIEQFQELAAAIAELPDQAERLRLRAALCTQLSGASAAELGGV